MIFKIFENTYLMKLASLPYKALETLRSGSGTECHFTRVRLSQRRREVYDFLTVVTRMAPALGSHTPASFTLTEINLQCLSLDHFVTQENKRTVTEGGCFPAS